MATFRICELYLQTLAGQLSLFGDYVSCVINLQTLAGEWPLFGFCKKWPLTCQGLQVNGQ
jgi:hypothetical protein